MAKATEYKTVGDVLGRINDVVEFGGADLTSVNQMGFFGNSPLAIAAGWGDLDAVRLLIEAGADVNARGEDGDTALHRAIMFGHADVAKVLIENNASTDERNDDGLTPLDVALEERGLVRKAHGTDDKVLAVALYIHGPDLDPGLISDALRARPTEAHRRGDVVLSPRSTASGVRKGGLWRLQAAKSDASVEDQIANVIDQIEARGVVISGLPGVTDAYLDIFAAANDQRFSLSSNLVERIHDMGIAVQVTFTS
jgi:hypothetical protein